MRPGRGLENTEDRLAAHAGDSDGVALLCFDLRKARAEAKIHALRHAVFSRRRARVDVRRNGAFNAPVLQKQHGKIPMVGADVGQSRTLRHKACDALQPRLKL